MEAVKDLKVHAPALVPKDQLHPNDVTTATIKGTFDADSVPKSEIEYLLRATLMSTWGFLPDVF